MTAPPYGRRAKTTLAKRPAGVNPGERCRMLFAMRPGWFLERTELKPARRVS
jgi:hypothetical protein